MVVVRIKGKGLVVRGLVVVVVVRVRVEGKRVRVRVTLLA